MVSLPRATDDEPAVDLSAPVRVCRCCGQLVWRDDAPPDRDLVRELAEARAVAAVAVKLVRGEVVSEADVRECPRSFVAELMGGAAFGEKRQAARDVLSRAARAMARCSR
jgi:hypothetical protein